MGKCISRRECPTDDGEAVAETKEEVPNNTVEAKPKNETAANGQVEGKQTEEECDTERQENDASAGDLKTEVVTESNSTTVKEVKTVRIAVEKTTQENVVQHKTDDQQQIVKVISFCLSQLLGDNRLEGFLESRQCFGRSFVYVVVVIINLRSTNDILFPIIHRDDVDDVFL